MTVWYAFNKILNVVAINDNFNKFILECERYEKKTKRYWYIRDSETLNDKETRAVERYRRKQAHKK